MTIISPTHAGTVPTRASLWPLPPFDYHPQTRVLFGPGTLARLGEVVRELGGSRVLLVTDPGLEVAGHPQRALAVLQEAGLPTWLFDGVEENPSDRHVEAALEVFQPLPEVAAHGDHRAPFHGRLLRLCFPRPRARFFPPPRCAPAPGHARARRIVTATSANGCEMGAWGL